MSSNPNDSANNAAPGETAASGTMHIDPAWTMTLAAASLAAYNDFDYPDKYKPELDGYTFFGRFTGWDDWLWGYGREERYGLIFKSQTVANRFVVAFRGTDSDTDAFEDAFFEYSTFKPYRNSVSPIPDDVSIGFNDIYSTKGSSMAQTMQQQIFSMLPQQMSEVYITGHSLGGALSQLFTLDMRVSFPNVNIQTINFASPKVGGTDWGSACANAGAAQRIIRVINYWDVVPSTPPSIDPFDEYVSLGAVFETAFYGGYLPMDALPRHRLLNLQLVLKNCLPLPTQVWVGTFQDAGDSNRTMYSTQIPNASKDEMLTKLHELKNLERSTRAANTRSEPSTQS